MELKRIMLKSIGKRKIDSILLFKPIFDPVTLDMLHGKGDLVFLDDIRTLQAVHTIDYVIGVKLLRNTIIA